MKKLFRRAFSFKMSTLDSIKDPRTIASATALIAVGISWVHFQNEISALKEEQEELRGHLKTFIKAHPSTNDQIENLRNAVKILDNRLNRHYDEMKIMTEKSVPSIVHTRKYERLTDRGQTVDNRSDFISDDEDDDDLTREIAAMS